ncbi:30S ribosomal protein S8 [Gammaproteobacteria bacterium]|nr:30S ribosomal protein S8 [Gammaproteobacteria bacterium]
MSMQDPIADMFCRMKNVIARNRTEVSNVPLSKEKVAILEVFKRCGYIDGFTVHESENLTESKPSVTITLRRVGGQYSIGDIKRISKRSRTITVKRDAIPRVMGGLGTAILSTSKGVLSCREARKEGVGGEVYCYIYS